MTIHRLATVAALGVFAAAAHAPVAHATIDCPTAPDTVTTTGALTPDGTYTWTVDRYAPDVFEQLGGDTYGRSDVIHLSIGVCGSVSNPPRQGDPEYNYPFHDTQGRKTLPGLVPGKTIVSTDLYLPAAWDENHTYSLTDYWGNTVGDFQAPAVWATIADHTGVPILYPIVQFSNRSNEDPAPTPSFMIYSDTLGDYVRVDADINYDGWNSIQIEFDKNELGHYELRYVINGETVYTEDVQDVLGDAANDPLLGLKEVMLQGRNQNTGGDYDIYFSDTYAANLFSSGDTITGSQTGNLVLLDGGVTLDGADIDGDLILRNGAKVDGHGSFTGDALVADGGILGGTVTIDGNLDNVSGIVAPGNSPGIITVGGNYTGSLAGPDDTIPSGVFEADLSSTTPAAGTTYDQLNIGGSASGVTAITLTDLSAPGSAIGDLADIRLIQIGSNSPDPSTAFVQANRLVKNGHDILLTYGTSSDPTYPYYYGLTTVVSAETQALASVPAIDAVAGTALIGTYVDRRGLDFDGRRAVWGRAVGLSFDLGDNSGAPASGKIGGAQAGIDLFDMGNGWRFGFTAAWGNVSADLGGGAVGSSTTTNTAAGVYATYAGPSGFYADLLAQYRALSTDLDTATTQGMNVSGHSIDVAAEAGYRLQASQGLTIVPSAQLVYQSLALGHYSDALFDASYDGDSLTGRLGLLAELDLGAIKPFASVGVSGDLGSDQTTTVSTFPVTTNTGGARYNTAAGAEFAISAATHASLSGFYQGAFEGGGRNYGVNGTLRIAF